MASTPPNRIERLATPLAVTLAVSVVWMIWAVGAVQRDSVDRFINVGEMFLEQGSGSSDAIDRHHVAAVGKAGYDGQFFYYVALDPRGAPAYLDAPSYRYARALYPALTRAVSVGQPTLVPWALLLVNLVAVAAGTLALALLLRRRGASPVYACLFGFAPGLFEAVSRDLSEPLAYALVAGGLAAWWWDEEPRPLVAGVLFGLAALTRETTLLFPLALVVAALVGLGDVGAKRGERRIRSAAVLGTLSLAPYLVLRLVLLAWLGSDGATPEAARFPLVPFGGLLSQWPFNRIVLEQVWSVVIPASISIVLVASLTRRLGPSLIALILNVGLLIVFLPTPSYESIVASSRIALGVTCAFIACLAILPARHRAAVALGIAVFTMSPWFDLFPTAYGR